MTEIKRPADWAALAAELSRAGYRLWQWQYDIRHPEGFRAWFIAPGRPDLEFMTREQTVADAIVSFKDKRRGKAGD